MSDYDIHQTDHPAEESAAAVRRQFNRRFVFGLHLIVAGVISIILFVIAFTHPMNVAMWNGQLAWMGYARPDLMYVGSLLLGFVGLHGLWLLRREGHLRRRNLLFWSHTLFMFVSLALTFSYLTSWYFDESYKWADFYTPVSPGAPPATVLYALFLLTGILLVTFPIHGIVRLYRWLLERALHRSENADAKPKRGEMEAVVGDDGELVDWMEHEIKAKRLSQMDI